MAIDDPDRDPPSETEIGNVALGRLGARRISSFTDGTSEANACQLFYYNARDELLEHYNWDFAVQMVQLAADPTAPLFDRAGAFALPADFLRTLRPFPEVNTTDYDPIIQSGFIYTNWPAPFNLRYVAQVADVTRFSPSFRKALSLQLAAAMCEQLTQSNTKKQGILDEFKVAIADAKRIKAIQAVPIDAPTDDWLIARDSGLGGPTGWFNF